MPKPRAYGSMPFSGGDETLIAAFEHQIGYELPSDYRGFLLTVNGGRAVDDKVDLLYKSFDYPGTVSLKRMSGFFSLKGGYLDIRDVIKDFAVDYPTGYIPIAEGTSGSFIVMLCLRPERFGWVYAYDFEHAYEGDESETILAKSFEEFFDGLHPDDGNSGNTYETGAIPNMKYYQMLPPEKRHDELDEDCISRGFRR